MNDNIKAGAEIHAGDGGYQLSTQEKYEAFVAERNQGNKMNPTLDKLAIAFTKADTLEKRKIIAVALVQPDVDSFVDEHWESGWNGDSGKFARVLSKVLYQF
jgi:hypothetical protein